MKLLLLMLILSTPAFGQATIPDLIESINTAVATDDAKAFSDLFTVDGDFWRGGRRLAMGRRQILNAFQPRGFWSERLAPRIIQSYTRKLTADIAIVDGFRNHTPVLLIVRRENQVWRIVTMRVQNMAEGLEIRPVWNPT